MTTRPDGNRAISIKPRTGKKMVVALLCFFLKHEIDVTRESFLGINSWTRYLLKPLLVTERHHIVPKFGNQGTLRTLEKKKEKLRKKIKRKNEERRREEGKGKGTGKEVRKGGREKILPKQGLNELVQEKPLEDASWLV
jgi:hypothetical protein